MDKKQILLRELELLKDLYFCRLQLLAEEDTFGYSHEHCEIVFNNFHDHIVMSISEILGE